MTDDNDYLATVRAWLPQFEPQLAPEKFGKPPVPSSLSPWRRAVGGPKGSRPDVPQVMGVKT